MYSTVIWAIVLFIIGAVFGINMLRYLSQDKSAPNSSAMFHAVNAIGLVLVIIAAAKANSTILTWTAWLAVITALGGISLFYIDKIRKLAVPMWLLVLHPILGIVVVVLLIIHSAAR